VVTWGNGSSNLYVDGRLIGSSTYPGALRLTPGTPILTGGDDPVSGLIERVTIYGRPIAPDEIAGEFSARTDAVAATASTVSDAGEPAEGLCT
jgi:hypothetical protein